MNTIKSQFEEAGRVLDHFMKGSGSARIAEAGDLMVTSLSTGGKIMACGNGGSLCDAMHFCEELTGRFREDRPALAALALADPGHLTCTANDFGYDEVFARMVQALGKPGDVLLAISTSGNSENVILAAVRARELGIKVVALTGKDGGKLAARSDVEIRVEHQGYADRIQEVHIKIIHALVHYIEQHLAKSPA